MSAMGLFETNGGTSVSHFMKLAVLYLKRQLFSLIKNITKAKPLPLCKGRF